MRRRKKQTEHENRERWLVSYADFMTLLFAFFVVLYASAQVDNKKIEQVAAAIQGGFQQMGVFSGTAQGAIRRGEVGAALKAGTTPSLQSSGRDSVAPPQQTAQWNGADVDVSVLRRELEEALGEEIRKHEVQMRIGHDGLIVSLRELGFFNSGEATLLTGAESKLMRIARVLETRGFEIRIEGHTDNVPIHTAMFKSNWELSTARATEVAMMLVERDGFDPKRISVAGYSEYRPVASNDTEEGKKVNRRVDLVIVSRPQPSRAQAEAAPLPTR